MKSISYEEFFKEELELEKQKIESPNNRKQKTGDFQIGIKMAEEIADGKFREMREMGEIEMKKIKTG